MNVQYLIPQRPLGRTPKGQVKEITYASYSVLHWRLLHFQQRVSPFLHRSIGIACSPCICNNLHVHRRTCIFVYYILYHHSLKIVYNTDNNLVPQIERTFPKRPSTNWYSVTRHVPIDVWLFCSNRGITMMMLMITTITIVIMIVTSMCSYMYCNPLHRISAFRPSLIV